MARFPQACGQGCVVFEGYTLCNRPAIRTAIETEQKTEFGKDHVEKMSNESLKNHGVEIVNTIVFAVLVFPAVGCRKVEFVGIDSVCNMAVIRQQSRQCQSTTGSGVRRLKRGF